MSRRVLPRMSLRERMLSVFSPRRAQRAMHRTDNRASRTPWRFLNGPVAVVNGAYDAASRTAYNRQWRPTNADADSILDPWTREDIRNKCRDHERNQAYAAGAANSNASNVIGANGLRPQSTVSADPNDLPPAYDGLPRIDKETARRFRRDIETYHRGWAESVTPEGMSYVELQDVVERTTWRDGECFVHRLMDPDPARKFYLMLEIIESDRVETPMDMAADPSVLHGIKRDSFGRIVGYYVSRVHPGSTNINAALATDYDFVPATDMIHCIDRKRPGQSRGESALAPVVNLFRDLGDYVNATILQAEVQACFCAVVESDEESGNGSTWGGETESDEEGGGNVEREQLRPRAIIRVPVGEGKRVHMMQPGAPSSSFDMFVMRVLRQLSAATGTPYEILAADFSKTNYSSARAAFEQARQMWRTRQVRRRDQLISPVWRWLVYEAVVTRNVVAPGYAMRKESYEAHNVIPCGWTHIDPQKEQAAERVELEDGKATIAEQLMRRGKDPDGHADALEREVKDYAKRGLLHPQDRLRLQLTGKVGGSAVAVTDVPIPGPGGMPEAEDNEAPPDEDEEVEE